MKKQIRTISKIAAGFMAYILVVGLLFPAHAAAQTKKAAAKPKPIPVYWYLEYSVTIKGNGREEGDASGSPTIVWSVDRKYSGDVALNGRNVTVPEALLSMEKVAEAYRAEHSLRFADKGSGEGVDVPFHVEINDKLETTTEEVCTDDSVESTTVIETWKADTSFPGLRGAHLDIDNVLRTYNVWIPVYVVGSALISLFTQTNKGLNIKNSPGVETKVQLPGLPNIQGLVNSNAVVEHNPEKPIPSGYPTGWEYYSPPDLTPDEPIFGNVPDSKNVKIRVIYRFSKTPFY